MASDFDPYSQWLGIPDGPRPPDHYTLLGLVFGEASVPTIAQAADMQMARLRRIRPGTQLADWSRLLDQLNAVKVCLSNPTSKAAYDASAGAPSQPQPAARAQTSPQPSLALPPSLAGGHGSDGERPRVPFPVGYSQAPTLAAASSGWSAPPTFVEPLPDAGVVPTPMPSTAGWSGSPATQRAAPEPQMPWTGLRPATGPAQQPQAVPAQPVPLSQPVAASVTAAPVPLLQSAVADAGLDTPPLERAPAYATASSSGGGITAWLFSIVLLAAVGGLGYMLFQIINKPDQAVAAKEGNGRTDTPPAGSANGGKPGEPTQVAVTPAVPAIVPNAQGPAATPPAGQPPSAVGPTPPKEGSPPSPAPPKDDATKRAAYRKAVSEARFAMSEREPAAIKRELQKARASAQTNEDFNELDRLDQIAAHLEGFWQSMRGAMPKLEGGELAVGDTYISVVEANEQRILVKAAGLMREYPVGSKDMSVKLIMAIAEKRFKMDPGWKVLYGTFLAMDASGDRDKARRLLQEAGKTGSADKLLPELSVPLESATKAPGGTGGAGHSGTMGNGKGADFAKEIADLGERAKDARTQPQHSEVARDALVHCQKACELKKWDDAAKLAEIAHTAAKAAKNVAMLRQATMAVQQIEEVRKQK